MSKHQAFTSTVSVINFVYFMKQAHKIREKKKYSKETKLKQWFSNNERVERIQLFISTEFFWTSLHTKIRAHVCQRMFGSETKQKQSEQVKQGSIAHSYIIHMFRRLKCVNRFKQIKKRMFSFFYIGSKLLIQFLYFKSKCPAIWVQGSSQDIFTHLFRTLFLSHFWK